jgi:D-aminoacyl-tRNA deacylase
MKAVLQRVSEAGVTINGNVHAAIGHGILILLGIEEADGAEDIDWLVNKIANLRIFDDAEGVMNLCVNDAGGEILLISQFTLHASIKKGNRPSYIMAARPQTAIPLYEQTIAALGALLNKPLKTGVFGADMKVALVNYGPVTIIIDTKNRV